LSRDFQLHSKLLYRAYMYYSMYQKSLSLGNSTSSYLDKIKLFSGLEKHLSTSGKVFGDTKNKTTLQIKATLETLIKKHQFEGLQVTDQCSANLHGCLTADLQIRNEVIGEWFVDKVTHSFSCGSSSWLYHHQQDTSTNQ